MGFTDKGNYGWVCLSHWRGSGAPDLLTVRAWRALEQADVIVCDKILGHGFVDRLGSKPMTKR